jgi:hypothetical protein
MSNFIEISTFDDHFCKFIDGPTGKIFDCREIYEAAKVEKSPLWYS